MIIVSQDKERIINFKNITDIDIEFIHSDYELRASFVGEVGSFNIGNYETEERAKEVLQEIVSKYGEYLKLEGGPAIIQGQMDVQPNIFNIPKIYEMPER